MKRHITALVTVCIILCGTFQAVADEAVKIVVYDVTAETGVSKGLAKIVTESFLAELRKKPGFSIVAQNEIKTLLDQEAQKQLLGCDDTKCMVEIAGMLGADRVIVGQIAKVGQKAVINIKMLDAATGDVMRHWQKEATSLKEEIFLQMAKDAATMMTADTSSESSAVTEESLRCPPGMALVKGGKAHLGTRLFDKPRSDSDLMYRTHDVPDTCIDRYEFPNKKGELPKAGVTFSEAQKLCEGVGKRLCTEMEWELACRTPENNAYPYGNYFDPERCVTSADGSKKSSEANGSKARCAGNNSVFDLSGNLAEWVVPALGATEAAKGGSASSNGLDARCASRIKSPGAAAGLRCCAPAKEAKQEDGDKETKKPQNEEDDMTIDKKDPFK